MDTSNTRKRAIITWAEMDIHCKWCRRYLCYIHRPGVTKWIKRQTNKRERREAKLHIKEHE